MSSGSGGRRLSLAKVGVKVSLAATFNRTRSRMVPMRVQIFVWLVAVIWMLVVAFSGEAAEALWKAGVAKANITPQTGLWLAGYATRDKPAEGKLTELWIKALALEDSERHRAVILTSDLLGIPQTIYTNVSASLKEKFGLTPD